MLCVPPTTFFLSFVCLSSVKAFLSAWKICKLVQSLSLVVTAVIGYEAVGWPYTREFPHCPTHVGRDFNEYLDCRFQFLEPWLWSAAQTSDKHVSNSTSNFQRWLWKSDLANIPILKFGIGSTAKNFANSLHESVCGCEWPQKSQPVIDVDKPRT